jgi:hypothetical protein
MTQQQKDKVKYNQAQCETPLMLANLRQAKVHEIQTMTHWGISAEVSPRANAPSDIAFMNFPASVSNR